MFDLFNIILSAFIYIVSEPYFYTLAFIVGLTILIQKLWSLIKC